LIKDDILTMEAVTRGLANYDLGMALMTNVGRRQAEMKLSGRSRLPTLMLGTATFGRSSDFLR
jgi:hypothetical protein